jgi:hypothetical protein
MLDEHIFVDEHVAVFDLVEVKVRTRLLQAWTEIAVRSEHEALEARSALTGEAAAGKGLELQRERNPSMVAIAASAHALEGLYGELLADVAPPNLAEWERNSKKGIARRVVTAVGYGFDVDVSRWGSDIKKLFELRNQLVHPRAKFAPPIPHP